MRIQIGNLDQSIEDRTLALLFARHGAVLDARVATHWETGRSTGVGFVNMQSDDAGERAIAALNGQLFHGRALTVCWTKNAAEIPAPGPQMFESMNIIGKAKRPAGDIGTRGLPDKDRA
jgi:RNA recognition motif-containing protein